LLRCFGAGENDDTSRAELPRSAVGLSVIALHPRYSIRHKGCYAGGRQGRRSLVAKGGTGAAAGGGIYGLGIFGALFYYWQQADAFWEYVWAIFPKAVFWPAFLVYEGFSALGA
jgi:hypothetical protein